MPKISCDNGCEFNHAEVDFVCTKSNSEVQPEPEVSSAEPEPEVSSAAEPEPEVSSSSVQPEVIRTNVLEIKRKILNEYFYQF